jgi:hypothetical protein
MLTPALLRKVGNIAVLLDPESGYQLQLKEERWRHLPFVS